MAPLQQTYPMKSDQDRASFISLIQWPTSQPRHAAIRLPKKHGHTLALLNDASTMLMPFCEYISWLLGLL